MKEQSTPSPRPRVVGRRHVTRWVIAALLLTAAAVPLGTWVALFNVGFAAHEVKQRNWPLAAVYLALAIVAVVLALTFAEGRQGFTRTTYP